ncbi:major capsid protein [Peptostreptococcus sp. D1]|uniref:major capsid protein n=1 Tax=Peptostreptococcus sp. D1 TaxID=72304 RepID=UPI0008E2B1F8|nr:major capsid protein [Peptostreptococcus sp. D1]SFE91920.1 Phage major capsid protein E [Peptostreptococcus sp. D1]
MAELKDFLNSKNIALYINGLPPVPTIDEALFPTKKILGIELEHAKGSKKRPVALKLSTFDVQAKLRALKADVKIEKKEMPFFKEAVGLKENDRRQIVQALASNNSNIVDMLMKEVFENYSVLVEGGLVQMKRMRTQLIQTGQINLTSDDGDVIVDYGIPSENKETLSLTARWSQTDTSDIVGDIKRWQKKFTDKGLSKPTRMLLTEKTWSYITSNAAIIKDLKTRSFGEVILTDEDFVKFLKVKCDIEIAILSGVYLDEKGVEQKYYKDNVVTLIPNGTLGNTVYGTTPEEFDSKYGSGKLDTSIVREAIAITTMVKEDPVGVDTKVSMIGMPSFDRIDECFFATVSDE